MKLTREQEEKLLIQYEPFIRSCVNEFVGRGRPDALDRYEDFLQEARLEFLIQLRKRDTLAEVTRCRQRIKDALREYCRAMYTVHIPRKQYAANRRGFSKASFDIMDDAETTLTTSDDHIVGVAVTNQFVASLSDDERTILRMKETGNTNRKIMPAVHARNETHMCRMIKRLQQKVLAFINDV